MSLTLYYHPLASFCHKVLVALYESGAAFTPRFIDLSAEADRNEMNALWALGKFPVLRDDARGRTLPESSIIIEHLCEHVPGARALLPSDPAERLDVRLWDRVFDAYVQVPMQKIVVDRLRPEAARDALGVDEARATLATAYDMLERQLERGGWIVGDTFTMADCAAAPALFYALIVAPAPASHVALAAYFERLLARPSVRRTIDEARPYFSSFPYVAEMPARFLDAP